MLLTHKLQKTNKLKDIFRPLNTNSTLGFVELPCNLSACLRLVALVIVN